MGFCFHIFYCYSAGLSNVVCYNRVFVIAGLIIAGCHCNILMRYLTILNKHIHTSCCNPDETTFSAARSVCAVSAACL